MLCSITNFAVQSYLRAMENKFGIVIYPKINTVMIYIFEFYIFEFLHSLVFIFHHVYSKVIEMLISIRVLDKTDVDMLI